MKLEELWEVVNFIPIDMVTKEKIDSEVLKRDGKKEVLEVSCDKEYNILIRYEKED